MHGLSLVQIHTPFTSRHFLIPQDNPALSLFGNKDHETNTDQLTAVAHARQRWEDTMKSLDSTTDRLVLLSERRRKRREGMLSGVSTAGGKRERHCYPSEEQANACSKE